MMKNEPTYINGVKQWEQFSTHTNADPYWIWHRNNTDRSCVCVDVDGREIRNIDGEWRTVAYIERQSRPGRIREPIAPYLHSFMFHPNLSMKLGSLVRDARILGIPAYFVYHSEDLQQFVVVLLPWDGRTFRDWSAHQYKRFIEGLGKQRQAVA